MATGREFHGIEPLADELAGAINIGPVCKRDDHLRVPELGYRTEPLNAGQAAESLLDRERDLGLHLFGSEGGGRGVDLDLNGGRVGESVDIDAAERFDSRWTARPGR